MGGWQGCGRVEERWQGLKEDESVVEWQGERQGGRRMKRMGGQGCGRVGKKGGRDYR